MYKSVVWLDIIFKKCAALYFSITFKFNIISRYFIKLGNNAYLKSSMEGGLMVGLAGGALESADSLLGVGPTHMRSESTDSNWR